MSAQNTLVRNASRTTTLLQNALVAVPVMVLLMLGVAPRLAHAASDTPSQVVVSAQGSVDAAPDMAILSLTVRREAATARVALDQNNAAMKDVISALKSTGIAERDLQTGGFSITPKMSYPNRSAANRVPKLVGYTVQNTLTVRVRALDRLGAILDKAVTLGVNQGGGIQFTNDKPAVFIEQARRAAVRSAMAKGQTLADEAGVTLGNIIEISEHTREPRPVMMARGRVATAAMAEESVPLQAGENTYSVTVNMRWTISQ